MKISIITVCYNAASTIEETILSVLTQTHPSMEYIIIDGGSTDQTMRIVNRYRDRIAAIVSEKDLGIYDAMNKGIARAGGEVVGILNADDVYAGNEVLAQVAKTFKETSADAVYGNLQYLDAAGEKVVRVWRSGHCSRLAFLHGWMPPHPAFFLRKECYEQYGNYSLELRSSSDYELMLRMLFRFGLKASWLDRLLVNMRSGGISNASLWSRLRANKEDARAWKMNGLTPLPYTLWLKPLRKIPQFIKARLGL
jgi:glycosyltransferase involved in cell wall biosynthesis